MKVVFTALIFIMFLFMVYFMSPRVWAEETAPAPKKEQMATKELMGKFLSHMQALKPFMVSEDKFSDSKNFGEIDKNLKELSTLVKKAGHDPRLQLPGYRVSRNVLENHIAETEQVFRIGNKHYARWMLNSTLSICMSCHTQMPSVSRGIKDFEKLDTFTAPFDQAEFLFATRAFDQAKDIYDKLISNYPEGDLKTEQLEAALQRVITYYSRIMRNPDGAIQVLEKYKKNDKLPPFLKGDIDSWMKAFKDWKKEPNLDLATATGSQVVDFARKNLDPKISGYVMTSDNPRAALYLKVSGVLYEFLQQHPNTEVTPEILYWLAICDKGLNNNFFYSLGDIYLRECIVEFPKSAVARQCYDEYEQETIISYSGSSGTHVPKKVRDNLDQLKGMITGPPPAAGSKH